jgi:methionine synthase II (cobalamin-independent)
MIDTDRGNGWAWPAGSATGIGSLPGTDIVEAVKTVLGELPEFPYLPELPARGPGADAIGRTAALLVDLPVEVYAARWRIAGRPGRDLRRAHDLRERDLDALTEEAAEFAGPLKAQAVGPWTLAAALELPHGGPVLRDPGAVRDLAASLAEGLRAHVAELRARLPGASLLLQLDEPSLPAVLAGRVPTESGFGTLPAVEPGTAVGALRSIVDAVGVPVVVHCCAADVPLRLLRDAGAAAVAVDLNLANDLDALGEVLDGGLGLLAGAAATTSTRAPSSADIASRVRRLWRDLSLPFDRMPAQVVVTPACGLAGASPEYARAVQAACREAGRRLADEPEAG